MLYTISNVQGFCLDIIIASMLPIGVDNHCFQVSYINRISTDYSHQGRTGNLFTALLLFFNQSYPVVIKALETCSSAQSTHPAVWYSTGERGRRCILRPLTWHYYLYQGFKECWNVRDTNAQISHGWQAEICADLQARNPVESKLFLQDKSFYTCWEEILLQIAQLRMHISKLQIHILQAQDLVMKG